MGWIYAFQDSGYDRGVKIGCDSSRSGLVRYKWAGCYTPRQMVYIARWQADHAAFGFRTLRELEERLAHRGLPDLRYPANGREWFDVTPKEAIARVTENLRGLAPETKELGGLLSLRDRGYDHFRDPRDLHRANAHEYKEVLWVYEEHLTGRVKTQRCNEWEMVQEIVKTYSRNGFSVAAAFMSEYSTKAATQRGNLAVLDAWTSAMNSFSAGPDDLLHGWLAENVRVVDVIAFYESIGLTRVTDFAACPPGVKLRRR